ncbi:hypothetical protein AK88_04151 [Plasmodium fragile]|uniref:Uncharacterized protein n=1 Tax=Plasmodium fragile TaxID=5857 RepID=A0A0D9QGK2_PLAFR|nr:uncharacterized protein AK88_04151 [Plasmodium fragile]KJP86180.1 hypothetical protein AK88_04151 [Plasmodium fragile]
MEESKHGTEYASETSCNQELLMDNILYTFQYRLWKDYNWCSRHARKEGNPKSSNIKNLSSKPANPNAKPGNPGTSNLGNLSGKPWTMRAASRSKHRRYHPSSIEADILSYE